MPLTFTFAAMNGGKSTLLLQTVHSARSRGFTTIVVGYGGNTRDVGVASRLGVAVEADLLFSPDTHLREELEGLMASHRRSQVLEVVVDEAQFLTPRQVEDLRVFATLEEVDVHCFGLRTNFETRAFPGAQRLLELSDEVVNLSIVRCSCGEKALFNARFSPEGLLLQEGAEEVIEGEGGVVYDPVCPRCFLQKGGSFS